MRCFIALCLSAVAFGQAPLIGVNSVAKELPAGARDVVTSIIVDPSAKGGDLLAVMLAAEGVAIEIELPDGRRFSRESSEAAGFKWEIAGQGRGDDLLIPGLQGSVNHLIMLPTGAPKGEYSIHADASGLRQKSVVQVIFLPFGSPGAAAGAQQDTVRVALLDGETRHYAGQVVELVAGVFEGNRGVANAKVSGAAVAVDKNGMPMGKQLPVQFKAGGPGSYNAQLPQTAVGEYRVGIKVSGRYANGTSFERVAATTVTIEPRRAQLLRLTEQPVDLDGNGLTDRIDVTADVHVDLPGQYSITVDLKAAPGKYTQGYGKARLEAGERRITALFGRSNLTSIGADGPYRMSARLWREEPDSDGFASLLEDAGETRAYKQASFDREPIYFTGAVRATPESVSFVRKRALGQPPSATGRAGYNRLAVTFNVFTPGGYCSWGGDLSTERYQYRSLEFLNGHGILPRGAGQITLLFDGRKISDRADGKAVYVGIMNLFCGRLEAHSNKAPLPVFPAGTFTKPPPYFELKELAPFFRISQKSTVNEVLVGVKTMGGFNETLAGSVEGLPPGISVKGLPPVTPIQEMLMFDDALRIRLEPVAVPRGTYKFTVRAKGTTMERTKIITISVE